MEKYKSILITIPIISALLALNGFGMFFRFGVSISCIIILCIVYNVKRRKDIWIFIAALLFSIIGDWFLSHRKGIPVRFIYGIIFYFIAHLGYIWFSLKNGKINIRVLALVSVVYLVLFFLLIYPNIDDKILMAAVLCYLLISCVSFAAATGIRFYILPKYLFVAGIASILFSDTIIAFKEFVGYKELNFLIMPTYYLSHILMTLALIRNTNSKIKMNSKIMIN
jgi:uncharacterized membrane protein YhhN